MKSRLAVTLALSMSLGFAAGCRSDPSHPPPPPPPPPLPTDPSLPTPTPEPSPAAENAGANTDHAPAASKPAGASEPGRKASDKPASTGSSLYDMAQRGEATLPSATKQAPAKSASPTPPKATPAPTPAPVPAPAPPKPTATSKVRVPSTANVRVELPAGLQATLDRDPRMQPWVDKAIKVADNCYTKARQSNAQASGVIKVRLTLHDEQRPSADVVSVPAALSSVVMCTTGGLLNVKMPLFTGKEGEKHLVSVHFKL